MQALLPLVLTLSVCLVVACLAFAFKRADVLFYQGLAKQWRRIAEQRQERVESLERRLNSIQIICGLPDEDDDDDEDDDEDGE